MKQTAIEYLLSVVVGENVFDDFEIEKAEEMQEQQQDDFAIEFAEWFTNEKSEYSIMYGNQEKRFATFTKDYTTKELLEIFKTK
jgi:hypothetical protein